MYRFAVTKPYPLRHDADEPKPSLHLRGTAEQSAAIREIKDVLLTIFMRWLEIECSVDITSDNVPFHLYEMHPGMASILGLEPACWVMIELTGIKPTMIFEDRDLEKLHRQTAGRLREAAAEVQHQLENPAAFTMLTKQ